jgi:hypothetical protein
MSFDRPTVNKTTSPRRFSLDTMSWSAPLAALFGLLAAGCSGGSTTGGSLYIETCSLGCGNGLSTSEVSCQISDTSINADIAVYFSEPVDPASVSAATFQIVDVGTGSVPLGVRFVDPTNPKKVVFRPNVSFDAQANPVYGLTADRSYRITIGGSELNDEGPFIRSVAGRSNATRLRCEVRASLGVVDLVPGSPNADSVVDVVDEITGDLLTNQPANGAENVATQSSVTISFNDLMNPASLTNFIRASVDTDGDLSTTVDRVALSGSFDVDLDTANLTTRAVFTPSNGMPSAGSDPDPAGRRKVLIDIPANCIDLAGNQLANAQTVFFIPQAISFDPVVLPSATGEQFTNTTLHDAVRSSALWGSGRLTRGTGGGSGRHGDVVVGAGQAPSLNTVTETFPLGWLQTNPPVQQAYEVIARLPAGFSPTDKTTWPTASVRNGAFEFSRFVVQSNGTVRFDGAEPARVFSRGNMELQGIVNVSGGTPADHASDAALGEVGAAGGPAAGAGGDGATRNDSAQFAPGLVAVGGTDVPNVDFDPNGGPGGGVGNIATLAAGTGGTIFPSAFPEANVTSGAQAGGAVIVSAEGGNSCRVLQVASPGGGGAYATDGGAAQPATITGGTLPTTIATGGSAATVGLEAPTAPPIIRKLEYNLGYLRGGSGGGGGGLDMFWSSSIGFPPSCSGPGIGYEVFRDNSAASGGGGGGALQLVSGGTLSVNGLINLRGGTGGSASTDTTGDFRKTHAQPGGGGSGGALRMQAKDIELLPPVAGTNVVDVRGGAGGVNRLLARGGAGGAGLVRLEDQTGLVAAAEFGKILPNDTATVGTNGQNILSVGNWATPRIQPDSYTAGMSCWMKPTGNFFEATFTPDDASITSADDYGWNMNVIYEVSPGVERKFSYRGRFDGNGNPAADYPVPGGQDFETALGNNLNFDLGVGETESYIAVRFQGAVVTGTLLDPCSVVLTGPTSTIVPGSETVWMEHPEALNAFLPRPNMIRFVVVFDTKQAVVAGSLASKIKGVTDLRIKAQPD